MASRFDGWSRTASALVAGLLVLVVCATGAMNIATIDPAGGNVVTRAADGEPMSDVKLYRSISDDVRAGGNYYASVARHHREHGYPLKPFVVVRLPALAYVSAAIGAKGMQLAMLLLVAAAGYAWFLRLQGLMPLAPRHIMVGLIGMSGAALCSDVLLAFHESWSAVFIALSLALWRPGAFAASVAAGLAAALFRDLALAYLVLMAAAALMERRWQELAAWTGAAAIMAGVLVLHANAVAAVVLPGDLASQGWNSMKGWPYYVAAVINTSLFILFPAGLAQALVPVSLFGWIAWRSELGLRVTGLLAGYATLLMLFARQENFYWSLLTTPLLASGLVLAALALHRLAMQINPETTLRAVAALKAGVSSVRQLLTAPPAAKV